jgi:hypothetical protein
MQWRAQESWGLRSSTIRQPPGAGYTSRGASGPLLVSRQAGGLVDHLGRLAGLAIDASGALLVAEDTNSVVYRVSYPAGPAGDGGALDGSHDGGTDATDAAATD